MTGIEWLRTLHTKQLIELKNDCYKYLRGGGDIDYDGHIFNLEELKQVLSENLIFQIEQKLIKFGRKLRNIKSDCINLVNKK